MSQLSKRVVAEAIGTAFLLVAIVGSGIMGERLDGGIIGIALLANSIATGGALLCLIAALGPISGAHFNPAVSLADSVRGGLPWRELPLYIGAQLLGAISGVAAANVMFGLPAIVLSHRVRTGPALAFSEFLATFGLLFVIWGCVRFRKDIIPFAVAAYIIGAYWFTSSTSFANPAVTIARSLSDTFAGIRPADVPAFVAVQLLGAISATLLFAHLASIPKRDALEAIVPHETP